MEPLIGLVLVTTAVLVAGRRRPARSGVVTALRAGVAVMFLMTGVAHFVGMRAELVAMVPDGLPAPELLVTATGLLEIAGALAMASRRLAPWAAAGLSLLLVAMFPANVHLALTGTDLDWWDHLVPRTIMQLVFLAATTTVAAAGLQDLRRRRAGTGVRTPDEPVRAAR
ncbi:hypothetical protein GCM10009809_23590 [Isoptericola hypogeus]|uniref:DoxX family membrane protein n=1 Tax=Isoptericola hypogeus TaxID=300179 RepID=A0ABN2JH96_9MICO